MSLAWLFDLDVCHISDSSVQNRPQNYSTGKLSINSHKLIHKPVPTLPLLLKVILLLCIETAFHQLIRNVSCSTLHLLHDGKFTTAINPISCHCALMSEHVFHISLVILSARMEFMPCYVPFGIQYNEIFVRIVRRYPFLHPFVLCL